MDATQEIDQRHARWLLTASKRLIARLNQNGVTFEDERENVENAIATIEERNCRGRED